VNRAPKLHCGVPLTPIETHRLFSAGQLGGMWQFSTIVARISIKGDREIVGTY
jgi:hypothetical protein